MKKNNTAQLDSIDLEKDSNAKISSLMKDIFSYLSEQEVDITKKRFGIFERKNTLEEIGKSYGVTRERIRQIEGTIVKKIVSLNQRNEKLKELRDSIVKFVKEYGGIVEEYFLIDNFFKGLNENEKSFVEFLLSKVLIEDLVQEKTKDGSKVFYQLKGFASDSLNKIIKEVVSILEEVKEPLLIDDIFAKLDIKKAMENVDGKLLEMYNSSEIDNNILFKKTVESYLNVSDAVKKNVFGMWGTKSWKTVSPKRMSDKIYLILNKEGKPLHFKEITKIINESGFDKKPARDVTVHNELIIDDRYVLVGRGIYALKSWGYKKGAVADIIEEIIRENGSAMTKADILEEVSKQRIVKDSTIYLSLTNDKRFKKVATGKYDLAKR
ncbi:MAG: HTH domain-containing protein [Patescibacteria group bacterium]